jgi:hypothetical protein
MSTIRVSPKTEKLIPAALADERPRRERHLENNMSAAAQSPADVSASCDVASQPGASSSSDGGLLCEVAAPPNLAAALMDLVRGCSAHAGTVHLLDSYGLLHLVASEGIPESVREKLRTLPLGKGAAGMAIERRQAVHLGNIQIDSLEDGLAEREATGLKQALAFPIFRGEAVIGALGIETYNERTFSDVEIAALLDAGRSMAAQFLGSLRSSGR